MKVEDIFDIEGKVFLVTGAYGLIGSNLCHFLDENNATVVAVGKKEEKLKDLKAATIFKADISNEGDVISLWRSLEKEFQNHGDQCERNISHVQTRVQ